MDYVFRGKNRKQSAYQIKVGDKEEALNRDDNLLWNTVKQILDQKSQVRYTGGKLSSGQSCYFKIRVWDENDIVLDWSETGIWTTGLLNQQDWKAKWISFKSTDKNLEDPLHLPASPYLRKPFSVAEKIKKTTLYVTSLGVFEMSMNRKRIGKDLLAPGWSDYN